MPDNETDTSNTTDEQNEENENNEEEEDGITTDTSTSGCVYDEYGRTPDKSQICGIGLPSASADESSGFQKCVFENKCPWCGKATLRWGWNWQDDPEKVSVFQGTDGTAEGHFYCIQEDGGCDADYSAQGNEHINGSDKKMTMISGPTPSSEEEAQKLVNGQMACDGSTASSGTSAGGGAVKIPDITFYGLIKQMMGAVDAEFVIANNMAYLISFKDIYEYRNQFDEYIPKIEKKDVINGSLVKNYTTDSFYNAVEVEYADGIIEYQNDNLVKYQGKHVFYYSFPEDDEETAKAKADALLSAHIRDYSTQVQLSTFFNENITEGSWVKVHKSITNISGKTRKEIQQAELEEQQEVVETKRKGINITNLTESTTTTDEGVPKHIRTITDEEGETYEIELEDSDYELFFVQGYTCRWDSQNSLIMDIELKYGPDSPDDPINATVGSLGGTDTNVGGQSADINEFVSSCISGASSEQDKAEKLYNCLCDRVVYELYQCSVYSNASDCLKYASGGGKTDQGIGINCADSSTLVVACYKAAGFEVSVMHGPNHFWNEVIIDGKATAVDISSGSTGKKCTRPIGTHLISYATGTNIGDAPSC